MAEPIAREHGRRDDHQRDEEQRIRPGERSRARSSHRAHTRRAQLAGRASCCAIRNASRTSGTYNVSESNDPSTAMANGLNATSTAARIPTFAPAMARPSSPVSAIVAAPVMAPPSCEHADPVAEHALHAGEKDRVERGPAGRGVRRRPGRVPGRQGKVAPEVDQAQAVPDVLPLGVVPDRVGEDRPVPHDVDGVRHPREDPEHDDRDEPRREHTRSADPRVFRRGFHHDPPGPPESSGKSHTP